MESSVLLTIKKALGLDVECTDFDTDLIIFINDAIFSLCQLGVVAERPNTISGPDDSWDFISGEMVEFVKNYVFLKVRLAFDPPANSSVLTSIEKQIHELEWRLLVHTEFFNTSVEGGGIGSILPPDDIPTPPEPDYSDTVGPAS